MRDGKLGVCVVGCGDMGTKHTERWNALPDACVVAVCDIRPDRGEQLSRLHGLSRWYDDYREAVALPGVDVVSVCVPTYLHPAVTIAAAGQRKHVLSEKPIALNLEAADSMIEATASAGVKLGIGLMRRYSPSFLALHRWLDAGGLGRPLMYTSLDARELRPKREMHDPDANGGPVVDMGVHLFDTWNCLFGSRPQAVYAQGFAIAAGRSEIAHIAVPAVDTATVQVTYESGDVGIFTATWGLPPRVNPAALPDMIYGPKGAAEVTLAMRHQVVRVLAEGGDWETISNSDQDMYQLEIETFAHSILEDRPVPAEGARVGKRSRCRWLPWNLSEPVGPCRSGRRAPGRHCAHVVPPGNTPAISEFGYRRRAFAARGWAEIGFYLVRETPR